MGYMRNLILIATLLFISISTSNASADADDFNLDYDDPTNGESSVDPDNTIEMKVQIENVVNQPMSFEMKILNDDELQSSGIDVWWSHNGDDTLTSKSNTIPKVDVSDNSIGFDSDNNEVMIITQNKSILAKKDSKLNIARNIIDLITKEIKDVITN